MEASRVECYSSSSYARRPRRIDWAGHWLPVSEVLTEWRAPQGKGFLVQVEDGRRFECFYYEDQSVWRVTER